MRRLLLIALCCLAIPAGATAREGDAPDGVTRLLSRLESTLQAGAPAAYTPLLSSLADRDRAAAFATSMIRQGVRRAVVRERDRVPLDGVLPGDGYLVTAEVLLEADRMARLGTWVFEVRRPSGRKIGEGGEADDDWRISDQRQLGELPLLHRLTLETSTQLVGRDIVITAPDLRLVVPKATIFVAKAGGGPTALVVLGRGEMHFAPPLASERGQVRIFAGSETLHTPFEAVLVRLPPDAFAAHVAGTLTPGPADPNDLKRAEAVFAQDGGRSYVLDLDLSPQTWSLLPSDGDFIAEVRTQRFGNLTYTRVASDAEDISLFHRARRRSIAVYASPEQLARRGRFYSEDDAADVRVTAYEIDASFEPAERRIEGLARLKMTVRAPALQNFTLKLAEPLAVTSAVSDELGRLLTVRVRNQNSLVFTLPSAVTQGTTFTLNLAYGGKLTPQDADHEAVQLQEPIHGHEQSSEEQRLAESYLYSNRSYWYPQAPTSGYATATLRLRVPADYGCVASGRLVETSPAPVRPKAGLARRFTFVASQPVRYLAWLITPLVHAASTVLRLEKAEGEADAVQDVTLAVKVTPRLQRSGPSLAATAGDALQFYAGLLKDSPYPHETVAAVEKRLPGGHSPAYMAVLNHPLPGSRVSWRDDPATFERFPEFFTAHELAHQWWGQAVGWKNYHEQWLSEGLAQYFAALYAERIRGREVFDSIVRRFRESTLDHGGQGPIYLGYRVGHIKGDSRAFRAIVYNKAALVLHMLRRLVGDEAFFTGLRGFYNEWRFRKAGSDDLRRCMEAASGRDLSRFFERWVYEDAVPVVSFGWKVEPGGQTALVRLQQDVGLFDLPVTVTVQYRDGSRSEVVVPLTERVTEQRLPLRGAVNKIVVNADSAALGIFRAAR